MNIFKEIKMDNKPILKRTGKMNKVSDRIGNKLLLFSEKITKQLTEHLYNFTNRIATQGTKFKSTLSNASSSTKPKLCTRGVIYVTPICNLNCIFCYYRFLREDEKGKLRHPQIEELKKKAYHFRYNYGLDAVDLTGFGEPTLYPKINDLVRYCNRIGLRPTIITSGQLTNKIKELVESGNLDDILLSIHDMGENYEKITVSGSWRKLIETLDLIANTKFPFRTNMTITKMNLNRLREVIDLVNAYGSRIHNFIIFNPHEETDWKTRLDVEFQAAYSEIEDKLKEAIEHANSKGLWCNVRYIPLCIMKGYEQHVCNFHQWIFDPYEWEECSNNNLSKFSTENEYIVFIKQKTSCNYFTEECTNCANRNICDGIYPQYVKRFGTKEFIPLTGIKIDDPMYYREKFVKEYSK